MGTHQPPKSHIQITIQSAVMSPNSFQHKGNVPFTSFYFLELFAYCVPLNASLKMGFSQNENMIL